MVLWRAYFFFQYNWACIKSENFQCLVENMSFGMKYLVVSFKCKYRQHSLSAEDPVPCITSLSLGVICLQGREKQMQKTP